MDGDQVGRITKKFGGAGRELFTNQDTYFIAFPRGADVGVKAAIVGATFLVDFMFYEGNTDGVDVDID